MKTTLSLLEEECQDMHEAVKFILKFEGVCEKVYDDFTGKDITNKKVGNATIGVGFNMDSGSAKNEWYSVFAQNELNFEDAKSGKTKVNHHQIYRLFMKSIQSRYQILINHYQNNWRLLSQKQKIAIMSVCYTNPSLVTTWRDKETNFSKHIKLWLQEKKIVHLSLAEMEIRFNSGSQLNHSLQNRRNIEADMIRQQC